MTAYIVRNREAKTYLGIFVAPSLARLWDAVDELADPYGYEWLRVTNGAIYFPGREPRLIFAEDDDAFDDPVGVAPSEMLCDILMGRNKWTRFDATDEGVGMLARAFARAGADCE